MKDEFLEKVEETLKKSKELISQAEERLRESEEFYRSLGIKKGKATEFLNRPDLPPEMKKRIEEEREKFQKELEEEIESKVMEAQQRQSREPKLISKAHMMRI